MDDDNGQSLEAKGGKLDSQVNNTTPSSVAANTTGKRDLPVAKICCRYGIFSFTELGISLGAAVNYTLKPVTEASVKLDPNTTVPDSVKSTNSSWAQPTDSGSEPQDSG